MSHYEIDMAKAAYKGGYVGISKISQISKGVCYR